MSKINGRHLSHLFPGIFILRYFYFTFSKIFILSFLQICEISKLKCHFHEIVWSFSWDSAWSEKPLFPPGLVKEVSWDLISKEVTYNPFPYRGSPWPCSGTDYNTTLCARSCSGESLTLGAGPGRARLQRWGELSWAEMSWDEMRWDDKMSEVRETDRHIGLRNIHNSYTSIFFSFPRASQNWEFWDCFCLKRLQGLFAFSEKAPFS